MRIPIDRAGSAPLYQQIEGFLRQGIQGGELAAGLRLPSARQVAQDLGVSRITVESAYAALEADGLVERRAGSGTYVLAQGGDAAGARGGDQEWPLWQLEAAGGAATERRAEAPAGPRHPAPISFTGFGDPRRFPAEEFYRAMKAVMRRDGADALGFGDPRGHAPLRATIAQVLSSQGVRARPDDILVTSGSQQAIGLVAQLLLRPGDAVLVEQPTYDGALELFRALGLRAVGCPIDPGGMQVERLEPLLQQHHPRLIYTIPNFQNPSGACMTLPRRRALVALADRYNVPVLEDDFAGELRYDGRALPALKGLDPGGRVIYVGTFSKLLMPGLRVGFIAADGPVYGALARRKWAGDLATATLTQRALDEYVTVGRYQAHVRRSCAAYRRRRDAVARALARHLPGARFAAPQGGLFVWVQLPAGATSEALAPLAAEEGVEYAHGTRFFADPADGATFVRLNFAARTPEEIEEGARRLGRALARLLRG